MTDTNGNGKTRIPQTLWEIGFAAAERYGIAAVLCGVLLYWGRQDRTELRTFLDDRQKTSDAQTDFIRGKLIDTIENNSAIIEKFNIAMNAHMAQQDLLLERERKKHGNLPQ